MAEKVYYLSDLERLKVIAAEMGLKAWKLENLTGAELQKPAPSVKPNEALDRIFSYLNSEVIPDGKYKLVGKTGTKSQHRTEILIQKGNDTSAGGNFSAALVPGDYSAIIKENAVLKADNYFLTEQVKVLQDIIAELKADLEEDQEEDQDQSDSYKDLLKEYAPQAFTLLQSLFIKAPLNPGLNMAPSFADQGPAAPPAAPQKIVRFTEAYNNFWRACKDQEAVNNEYNYLQNNRPDKLEAFTKLFTGDE